jgi:hypothetical protein
MEASLNPLPPKKQRRAHPAPSLKFDARGKPEGSGSAGAEKTARRGHSQTEVGKDRLCGLVWTDVDIASRIVVSLEPRIFVSLIMLKPSPIKLTVSLNRCTLHSFLGLRRKSKSIQRRRLRPDCGEKNQPLDGRVHQSPSFGGCSQQDGKVG